MSRAGVPGSLALSRPTWLTMPLDNMMWRPSGNPMTQMGSPRTGAEASDTVSH